MACPLTTWDLVGLPLDPLGPRKLTSGPLGTLSNSRTYLAQSGLVYSLVHYSETILGGAIKGEKAGIHFWPKFAPKMHIWSYLGAYYGQVGCP